MRLFSGFVLFVVVFLLCFSGCEPASSSRHATIYAFSASGCAGCILDKPQLARLERQGYKIVRVDIHAFPLWRKRYNIRVVPFYLVVTNGCVILRTHDLDLVIKTIR